MSGWWIIYITSDFNWLKKNCELWVKNNKKLLNILHHQKMLLFFCVCMYKMIKISAKTWNNTKTWNNVSVLKIHENDDVSKTLLLLLCISNISKRLGCINIYDLIDKEIKGKYHVKKMNEHIKEQVRKYKIDKSRFIKGSGQSMYAQEVIAIFSIMQTRLLKPETIKFRSDLRFNQIRSVEQSVVIIPLLKVFYAEEIKPTHKA